MKLATTIVYVHETLWQSWGRDLGSFVTIVALIGVGVYLESTALQWLGAIVGFIVLYGRAAGRIKRVSISEARELLDELERGEA